MDPELQNSWEPHSALLRGGMEICNRTKQPGSTICILGSLRISKSRSAHHAQKGRTQDGAQPPNGEGCDQTKNGGEGSWFTPYVIRKERGPTSSRHGGAKPIRRWAFLRHAEGDQPVHDTRFMFATCQQADSGPTCLRCPSRGGQVGEPGRNEHQHLTENGSQKHSWCFTLPQRASSAPSNDASSGVCVSAAFASPMGVCVSAAFASPMGLRARSSRSRVPSADATSSASHLASSSTDAADVCGSSC
jgi:hypothetical protein